MFSLPFSYYCLKGDHCFFFFFKSLTGKHTPDTLLKDFLNAANGDDYRKQKAIKLQSYEAQSQSPYLQCCFTLLQGTLGKGVQKDWNTRRAGSLL
jgi:hypothetical protein